jgi:hypothetical protein
LEPVNGLDKAAHYHVTPLHCAAKSRLDCFTFGLEVAIVGRRDSCAMRFQEFAQSLKCRPSSSPALPIGFELIQKQQNC